MLSCSIDERNKPPTSIENPHWFDIGDIKRIYKCDYYILRES